MILDLEQALRRKNTDRCLHLPGQGIWILDSLWEVMIPSHCDVIYMNMSFAGEELNIIIYHYQTSVWRLNQLPESSATVHFKKSTSDIIAKVC